MTPSEQPRMTASEKLERLDGAITDLTPFADGRFVSAITIKEPAAQSLVALRNALPELIVALKAAEDTYARALRVWPEKRMLSREFQQMLSREFQQMDDALTALERKLGSE